MEFSTYMYNVQAVQKCLLRAGVAALPQLWQQGGHCQPHAHHPVLRQIQRRVPEVALDKPASRLNLDYGFGTGLRQAGGNPRDD